MPILKELSYCIMCQSFLLTFSGTLLFLPSRLDERLDETFNLGKIRMAQGLKKHKSKRYPGVYFSDISGVSGVGSERSYYVCWKDKEKRIVWEHVGYSVRDNMTEARAAILRGEFITGKRSRKTEVRAEKRAAREQELNRWTIRRLWRTYLEGNTGKPSLKQDGHRFNKWLDEPFGDKEPHQLSLFEVNGLKAKILNRYKPQTAKNVLALLKRICKYGVDNGLSSPLPFRIKLDKVNNQTTEDLDPEEIKSLLEAIYEDEDFYGAAIVWMCLFTGMRVGELLKLEWRDVDFRKEIITLRDPKGKQDQHLPISQEVHDFLNSMKRFPGSSFVFPNDDGEMRSTNRYAASRIKRRAGLPEEFRYHHGLRHVFASNLASSGKCDMYTLQKLLTHKSPGMTQRYAHLRDRTLRDASNLAATIVHDAVNQASSKVIRIDKNRPD